MSVPKQPAKLELVPFQKENLATNQQDVPLPYLGGTRLVAGRYITPALNEIRQQVQGGGKKGGGSSGGKKGGGAAKSMNVYGTLAWAFCWGPLDWLDAVIYNGNYMFQGDLTVDDDVTDLTGSLADPTLIAAGGYLKLYRGTETQPTDAAIPGGARDKGTVKLVGKHIFFGQDSGSAGNLQIIGGRRPRVSTDLIDADYNVVIDKQVNPVAAFAEILLDERGAGRPLAELDADSWNDCARFAKDYNDVCFCSPLFTEQSPLRDIARQLLDPLNGFCRRNKQGKLACTFYEWGLDPGGLPLLDARHWIKKPRHSPGGWKTVKTETVVSFTDRDFEFQKNTVPVPNTRARDIRQIDDPGSLARPHITRNFQAHRQGFEYNRRIGAAPGKYTAEEVRTTFVRPLLVGDKVLVDTDPEPGGDGLAQLARVDRIELRPRAPARLKLTIDSLLPGTPYSPDWTPAAPAADESPPLEHFLAVPLPPRVWGFPPTVGIFATRPAAKLAGFEVFFGPTHAGEFSELGRQTGFAVRAQLHGAIDDDDDILAFTELDGLNAPDASLAADTPGGNLTEAEDNVLLALLAQIDGDGRVALNGDGDPIMEFVSIIERATGGGLPADTFNYTVLRGRLHTEERAWPDDTAVWIIPARNIISWHHELMDGLAGSPVFFRLVSYTSRTIDDAIPIPECSANMMPADSITYVAGDPDVFDSFVFKRQAIDDGPPDTPVGYIPADGWEDAPPVGTDPLYLSKARLNHTGGILVDWSEPVRIDGTSFEAQYSIDGATLWHDEFAPGDIYIRTRRDGGDWSAAAKIVAEDGEDGVDGAPGTDGDDGADGAAGAPGPAQAPTLGASESGSPVSGGTTPGISLTPQINIVSDGGTRTITFHGYIGDNSLGIGGDYYFDIYRDSTFLTQINMGLGGTDGATITDTPSAGPHTYYFYVRAGNIDANWQGRGNFAVQ